jgi:hypothetical protein
MTRTYGGVLIAVSLLHVLAALGPSTTRALALVAGQFLMLIGVWGLGFIAIPHAQRAGWTMIAAGIVGAVLLAVAFVVDLSLPALEQVGTFAAEMAVVAVFLSVTAGAWSLFRAPGAWRAVGWCLLFAAAAMPFTWLAAVLAPSLDAMVMVLRLGVTSAVLAYALGVGWAGALLWRAAG